MARWCATLLMLAAVPSTASAEGKDGQYFCYVDHVAGISRHGGQQPASGTVSVPESDMKFLIKIGPVVYDDTRRKICMDTIDYYRVYFEKSISFDEQLSAVGKAVMAREWVGLNCFTSEKISVTYPAASRNNRIYSGYGGSPEHFGAGAGNWFNFYGTDTFEMGFTYDDGPVVEYGHCSKIEAAK